MNARRFLPVALLLTAALAAAVAVAGDDKQPVARAEHTDADFQAAIAAAAPGPRHAALTALAGEYATVTRFFSAPGAEPMTSTGTARLKSVLDGRFIHEEHSGEMMGAPYTSVHLTGFNNGAGKYESTWAWTNSTGLLPMSGTSPDNGRTIHWEGRYRDDSGSEETIRAVARYVDPARFVMEMLGRAPDGTEFVVMDTTYTRKN